MGTEVLRAQDLLVERYHVSPPAFHRRRNFPAKENLTTLIINRRPCYNTSNKRTSPKPDKKKFNESKKVTHGGGATETRRRDTGQVTLLRRGESLDSLTSKANGGRSPYLKSPNQKIADDLAFLGTRRIGPDSPGLAPRHIRLSPPPLADVYAGSAFCLSPSPRSLPLPSFFNKKQDDGKISPLDDPATRDLRRLLRLD
ncbi:hypothetical protein ACS0TY_014231 [Phlomoides rotata]